MCEELPMSPVSRRVRRAGILGILALMAAVAGCGGDPAPPPPVTGMPASEPSVTEAPATSTTAPEPSVTEAAATSTSAPAASTTAPEPSVTEGGEFAIDEDTTLREVFNLFAGSEQACVRDVLGDELESMLDMPVLSEDDIDQSIAEIFSCLDPQTAREFFLSATIAALIAGTEEEGLSTEIGTDERACIRDRLADIDVASLIDILVYESADPVILNLLGCIPDLFIESILAEEGVALDELTDEQWSCLRGLVADTDWTALGLGAESEGAELLAFSFGLFACVPEFLSEDSASDSSSSPREDVADDHADSRDQATPVTVGEAAAGEIGHETDVDYFVFEAEQGRLYQIDVTLGTLPDSVATLYDPDGFVLEHNDDHADTTASRLYWEAQASGNLYVAVEGWSDSTGTYTLAVTALDVVDDHSSVLEGATPVTVGEAAAGEIGHETDVDYFVFEAEQGRLYQIDVTLETLPDSVATLYDPDGFVLEHNDDHADTTASRLYWEAQASGNLYVAVEGWSDSTGTYTLTIATR